MRNRAYTLAEVLVTLGIIGIIAALAIPGLVYSYKAYMYRSKFFKTYSTLKQATLLMEQDGISLCPKDHAFGELRPLFVNYFPGAVSVAAYSYDFPFWHPSTQGNRAYKTLNGSTLTTSLLDDGQIVLMDGTNLFINQGGVTSKYLISVDLNSYNKPPNRYGYDLFTFELTDAGKLVPAGAAESSFADKDKYCNINSSEQLNGIACSELVVEDSAYFKWMLRQH